MNPRRVTQHDTLPPGVRCAAPNGHLLPPGPRPRKPPVSNTERQRQFRERNPGYYGRLKAKERAESKARVEAILAVNAILHAYQTMPLMLPAPVEPIEIPGITTIPLTRATPDMAMAEMRLRDAA